MLKFIPIFRLLNYSQNILIHNESNRGVMYMYTTRFEMHAVNMMERSVVFAQKVLTDRKHWG